MENDNNAVQVADMFIGIVLFTVNKYSKNVIHRASSRLWLTRCRQKQIKTKTLKIKIILMLDDAPDCWLNKRHYNHKCALARWITFFEYLFTVRAHGEYNYCVYRVDLYVCVCMCFTVIVCLLGVPFVLQLSCCVVCRFLTALLVRIHNLKHCHHQWFVFCAFLVFTILPKLACAVT